MRRLIPSLLQIVCFFIICVHAQAITPTSITVITEQLDRPWSLAFLPNGDFLVTEKTGQLRRISPDGTLSPPIKGLPDIAAVGQGGLLDVALHPHFEVNHWVYLSFVAGNSVKGYSTEVIRGKLQNNQLTNIESLFVALPKTKGGRHFGGRLLLAEQLLAEQASSNTINSNTYLYISLGDRGVKPLAQQLSSHHGSLIRLLDNGDIPADNPFITTPNARPEIFSYGHRNIQGLALHPKTREVWLHEHGPQGGDELNHALIGKNYGWPVITYGVNYGIATKIGEGTHKAGMEQPQYYWDPSIAPSGLAFYNNQWFVGALKYQLLAVLSPSAQGYSEARYFEQQFGRIRDVRVNGNKLYLLTDSSQGKLIQLTLGAE